MERYLHNIENAVNNYQKEVNAARFMMEKASPQEKCAITLRLAADRETARGIITEAAQRLINYSVEAITRIYSAKV